MPHTDRALVLARGLGSRMRAHDSGAALTIEQQRAAEAGLKALMPIDGRPFLDYVLGSLAEAGLRSVGLVVGPGADPVRSHYANAAMAVSLDFIVQTDPRGTADAVLAAEAWAAGGPFLVLNADNLYPTPVLRALAALDGPGLPVFDRDDLIASSNIPPERVQSFALLEVNSDGILTRIVEKPSDADMPPPGEPMLVSMNCWRFDARIFDACRDVAPSPRGELELPIAVMLAVVRGVAFRAVPARGPVLDLSRRADAAEVARRLRGLHPTP
jgi:glucose-1-phosphate thymidylyltransferase